MTTFRATVGCEFRSLGDLRSALRDWLEACHVPAADRAAIVLAVHEATANALEHAGAPDSIAVRASVEDGLVAAEVTDLGRWKWVVPDRDRGRGLAIIAELVSELEIRPDPGGTTVRMVYPLDGGDRGGHPNGAEAARLLPRSPQRAAPYRPDNV